MELARTLGRLGVGAGLMYLLDPIAGKRRRAALRDKAVHVSHKTNRAMGVTWRDFSNRLHGAVAETQSRITRSPAIGRVLEQRVRSKLGQYVSHPGSIDVTVEDGRVILRGPVMGDEVDRLLAGVAAIPGVQQVEDRLARHEHTARVPGLQGGRSRTGGRFELLQEHWSPTARVLVGTGGAAVSLLGALRGGPVGAVLGATGLTLLARGLMNLPLRRLVGVGAGRRAVDLQKTIHIQAPVHEVFKIWTNYENFPRFMSHVREVTQVAPEWSHWSVVGPAGVPLEWDAILTEYEHNKVIAWKTMPGSIIQHTGRVLFEPDAEGGTRVHITMSYNPIAGTIAHELAELLGSDPKSRMDYDLMEMKSFIEQGRATTRNGSNFTFDNADAEGRSSELM